MLRRVWLCNPRLLCPWNFPGKNTGVGNRFLFHGIFPTQEVNPRILHCRWILYHLNHKGSPYYIYLYICMLWTSLVAKLVKNSPAMQKPKLDPWIRKISRRREWLTTLVFPPENSMDCIVHGATTTRTLLSNFHFQFKCIISYICILCNIYLYIIYNFMFIYIYIFSFMFIFSFLLYCHNSLWKREKGESDSNEEIIEDNSKRHRIVYTQNV